MAIDFQGGHAGGFKPRLENKPPASFSRFYKCRFVCFVVLHFVATLSFLVTGAYVLLRGHMNWRHTCEQAYHVKRYIRLNLVFIAVAFASYCLFSRTGCEQAARARATALTVMHLAFSMWGALTWRQIDSMCGAAGGPLLAFHHVAVVLNGAYFLFFLSHEIFMNPFVDWTVMPTVQLRRTEFVNFVGGTYAPKADHDRPPGPLPDSSLAPAAPPPPGHVPPQYGAPGDLRDLSNPNAIHFHGPDGSHVEYPPGLSPLGSTNLDASVREPRNDFPQLWNVNPHGQAATQPRHLTSLIEGLRHQNGGQRRNSQP